MKIALTPRLQAILVEQARQRAMTPEDLVLAILHARFLPAEPRDEWERRLFGAALDCGVSVSDAALSSDGLYE